MASNSTTEVFGLVIHGLGLKEALSRAELHFESGKPCWIVTANPEILLEAKNNPGYWEMLRKADLRLVDGFGLQLIGWLFGSSMKRVAGVDFAEAVITNAERRKWSVALLGGKNGIADRAAWNIRRLHPGLRIASHGGGEITKDGTGDSLTDEALSRLIHERPDILFVGFGHPKQEAWIAKNLYKIPGVKMAVGIGGTLDYWAGAAKRAPKWLRAVGLEWLWRITREPKRIKRVIRAVAIFPIAAVAYRLGINFKKYESG